MRFLCWPSEASTPRTLLLDFRCDSSTLLEVIKFSKRYSSSHCRGRSTSSYLASNLSEVPSFDGLPPRSVHQQSSSDGFLYRWNCQGRLLSKLQPKQHLRIMTTSQKPSRDQAVSLHTAPNGRQGAVCVVESSWLLCLSRAATHDVHFWIAVVSSVSEQVRNQVLLTLV